MPAQQTTMSAASSPRSVTTPVTLPPSVRTAVTSCRSSTATPRARANRSCASMVRTGLARPSVGTYSPPRTTVGSSRSCLAAVCSGLRICASSPQDVAQPWRRCSSASRAGLVATSMLPTGRKQGCPSRSSSPSRRTVYPASLVITFAELTWKTSPGACAEEPPAAGSAPWSMIVMSVQPRADSSSTSAAPTTPAPMTTTFGPKLPGPSWVGGSWRSWRALVCYEGPPVHASAGGEPGRDLVRVGVDPLLRRVVVGHLVGDVLGDRVLVVVGPAEVLDHRHGRAAGLHEGLAGDLVEVVRRVVARNRGRVRVAALGVGRQRHVHQRDLGEEPLRLVEVSDQELPLLLGGPERLDQRVLAAGVDHLEVQVEILHQRLVIGDVGRVAVEELALATGLGGLELGGVLVEVLVLGDVRVLLGQPGRHVPADDPLVAGLADLDGYVLLLDVLLLEVVVAPVLQDHVDRAGREALPGHLLGEVLQLHRAAELGLEDVGHDRCVGLIADPGVDRDVDGAAWCL